MSGDKSKASFLRWREIPAGVWALGIVSLLMDLSSEMIHALLPLYLVTVLGVSTLAVGVIEGIAEATTMIVKIFSGALSDRLGKRKWLAAAGYGLAALTKPIFPLAPSFGWLVAARFVDRIGKGIRGAPRDALVADLTPADLRGASFGLRQSLDTIGAILGPLVAIVFMAVTANHFTFVFWIAVVPAFLSFAVILFGVDEPARPAAVRTVRAPLSVAELRRLGTPYWLVVGVAAVFTLARFSEAFLLLRAQSIGLPLALVPIVMVVMNIVYAGSAWPAGVLSDSIGRFGLLAGGFLLLILADLALAFATGLAALGVGVALWGLHMGLTQGLFATLVADTAPPELRGTAFGMFNLVGGIATLAASILAGALWDAAGPGGTFVAGAIFAAISLAALPLLRRSAEAPA
ncbi:MAG TPA: MFS transporter [Xanthobacteraceae bacterium]|nr:MFS transporter [Xanthobacteraceae bacterium]